MNVGEIVLKAWSGNSNELVIKITNSVYGASVYLKLAYPLSPLCTQFTTLSALAFIYLVMIPAE